MDDSRWHIIRVAPGKEAHVQASQPDCASYAPLRTVRRFNRKHRVWRSYQEYMFPGYLFVRTEDPRPFLERAPAAHVFGALRTLDRSTFASLSSDQIDVIRQIEIETQLGSKSHSFEVGDFITPISGYYAGEQMFIRALEGLTGLICTAGSTFRGAVREVRVDAMKALAA